MSTATHPFFTMAQEQAKIEKSEKLNSRTVVAKVNGGKREGSGRKPKMQYEARELFNMYIDARMAKILENVAKWIDEGDKDMHKYILDQRLGKAVQGIDIGKNKGNVYIKVDHIETQQNLTLSQERRVTSETETVKLNAEKPLEIKSIETVDNQSSQKVYCATTGDDQSPPLLQGDTTTLAPADELVLQGVSGGDSTINLDK